MARPRGHDSDDRAQAFRASLVELGDFAEAASASKIDPARVLRLTRDPEWRALFVAVLEGHGSTATSAA